ncbi:histidine kinase dimerization/phosphoacceptor domain -containing protein [Pseudofulvibacter geojedonensis]|uniref:histidine kinase n=1 Tax=Pseudofulvibacter geojedonensis TaxID=1123758 RepID=A0ABW3I383_9FLAO
MKINKVLWLFFVVVQFVSYAQELDPDKNLFNKEEIEWIKEHPVIHFGYEPNWPPFEIYENGEYLGISGDYIEMIEIHTDIDMVPIPNITWQESITGLKKGEIKVAAIVGITEDRETYLDFTKPHVQDPMVIVTRSNYKFVSGVDDLENSLVVLPDGYNTVEKITKDYPSLEVVTTKNVKECLYQVSTGQADAFIGSLSVSSYYMNNNGFTNLKIAAPTRYKYSEFGLAVTKDWRIFRDITQKVFDHLSKEEHIEIRNKWVTVPIEKGVSRSTLRKYVLYALIVLALIITVFLLWNKTLMNEIKARKKIELDLKNKNEEKEILLKEVHHRVKNNLQIVHSMLNMQARRIDNDLTLKVLSESKSRVMAMAIVHKILYESEDISTINVEKYVQSLSDSIKKIFTSLDKDINISIEIQNVFLNIEKAIPIGLILNELLSNSFEHAFKNRDKGNILIRIEEKDSEYNFYYSDDGEGVTNYNMKTYKSLGMHLIYRLANQLQTEAEIHVTRGFNLSFSFKV